MQDHQTHHGQNPPSAVPSRVLEVSFKNCYDASEFADLEGHLSQLPGVQSVHLDRTRGVAHLSYLPTVVTESV